MMLVPNFFILEKEAQCRWTVDDGRGILWTIYVENGKTASHP